MANIMARKSLSKFTLTEDAETLCLKVAMKLGVSRSNVAEMAIRAYAAIHGFNPPPIDIQPAELAQQPEG